MKAIDKIYISGVFGLASSLAQTKEPKQDDLGANREAMLQNAGKMEVGKYDVKSAWSSFCRKQNQKWYNQFQNKRKRK